MLNQQLENIQILLLVIQSCGITRKIGQIECGSHTAYTGNVFVSCDISRVTDAPYFVQKLAHSWRQRCTDLQWQKKNQDEKYMAFPVWEKGNTKDKLPKGSVSMPLLSVWFDFSSAGTNCVTPTLRKSISNGRPSECTCNQIWLALLRRTIQFESCW